MFYFLVPNSMELVFSLYGRKLFLLSSLTILAMGGAVGRMLESHHKSYFGVIPYTLVKCFCLSIYISFRMEYHILWIFVSSLLFVCLYRWVYAFRMQPCSSTRAAALGLSLRSDSHSGPGSHSGPDSYCTVLTLIHALTLAALFWWWMVKVLVDLVLTVISARIEYNDRHVCLQF